MSTKKEKLEEIIGKEGVVDDLQSLEAYASDQSFVNPMKPRLLVKPRDAAQVTALVKWANETQTALIPVSSGPPHFRGDTVPGAPGAVIVDLREMNKIVHINARNRTAIIEPGVTYGQLQPALAKEGLRLSPPLAPRANKSVLTSLLEREPVIITRYQFAVLDPLRVVEVVWGDGNQFRCGEAAGQPSLEAAWEGGHHQINPRGPGQSDFYKFVSGAQGSMGIATWASVKCEVLPTIHKLFFVAAKNSADLHDLAYKLLRLRFSDETMIVSNAQLASILGKDAAEIKKLKETLPPWMLLIGVAGRSILPAEKVDAMEQDIRDIAQKFGHQLLAAVPGANGVEVLKAISNPSNEPYWKLRSAGGCQDIFFMTTLDKTPAFIKTMYSVADQFNYPSSNIGVYLQPVHQGASCHCEFSLPYNPDDKAEAARMQDLYAAASREMLNQGAFFSRPYGIWADMAYNRDVQTTITLKKLKDIFDPNNIMNPGKLCF